MLRDLLHNISFWSAFFGWISAQMIKFLWKLLRHRELDLSCFVSTGGMPSAHSCMVSALATSVGLRTGFDSALFAVSVAFAGIVMFDAQGVRMAASRQAQILNQIVTELFREHHLSQKRLSELLGHTRPEVLVGLLLGIACALLLHRLAA